MSERLSWKGSRYTKGANKDVLVKTWSAEYGSRLTVGHANPDGTWFTENGDEAEAWNLLPCLPTMFARATDENHIVLCLVRG